MAHHLHNLRVVGVVEHVETEQIACAADVCLIGSVEHECLLHQLLDSHLREDLGVKIRILLRIVAACLFKLIVEVFTLPLIFQVINLYISHFSHCGVVSEDVATVGQGVAYDKCEQRHADHDDQEH